MDARRKLVHGAGAAVLGAVVVLSAQAPATAADTATNAGAHQVCRGVTVDRTAPVVSRASVLIEAPLVDVWRLHADIDHWQSWIPEITPAHKETPGPLRPGSVFTWSPQAMHVESTVKTVAPLRCTAWGAPVNGITGVHLWTFKQTRDGVLATAEESWAGPPVEADIPGSQAGLDQGLSDWAHRLKDTAEARSGRR
ncbi:SRPBCC family protein [Umezawaea tangerina]|uniref:Polyketide cyclase/dehydrase/lipid transport protein n=1 Tax=Umezawaea tangerina TaxID=84725 RepID=A0A2T0T061_9PSEU|nr:SRPBCC family protein [Umezawaea tangerina]PRY39052.1 polyketide cyclase/dehydrase/lipid transport protein [Umezawaea tangerina]